MTKYLKQFFFLFSASILTAFLFLACNEITIDSKWRTQNISIDGINNDWKSGTYIKDANVLVNVCNDENFVYLSLTTNDRNLPMKIMRDGLIVWFDPQGKSDKTFGIHFPVGMKKGEGSENIEAFDPTKNMNGQIPMPKIEFNQFEILNEKGESEAIFSSVESKNIQIKMSNPNEKFFYEMKVPLKASEDFLYAINADTSKMISIGFEIPESEMKEMRGPKSGGMPEGGSMPGGDGGRPGGNMPPGGGMPPNAQGKGPDSSAKLDLWINVQLSSFINK
jgi:hypothetical protein